MSQETNKPQGWAGSAIQALEAGQTAQIRPKGGSMAGRVESGNLVTLEPIPKDVEQPLIQGDIVLVRVHGSVYLHLVKAIKDGRYQIGNNRGGINGWVGLKQIYGKAVKVEK